MFAFRTVVNDNIANILSNTSFERETIDISTNYSIIDRSLNARHIRLAAERHRTPPNAERKSDA